MNRNAAVAIIQDVKQRSAILPSPEKKARHGDGNQWWESQQVWRCLTYHDPVKSKLITTHSKHVFRTGNWKMNQSETNKLYISYHICIFIHVHIILSFRSQTTRDPKHNAHRREQQQADKQSDVHLRKRHELLPFKDPCQRLPIELSISTFKLEVEYGRVIYQPLWKKVFQHSNPKVVPT